MHASSTDPGARVAAVVDHVHENLAGDLSLQALARRSGLSPFYFHRVRRRVVGEPPMRYVLPPCRFRRTAARRSPLGDLRPRVVRYPPRRIAFVRRVGPYDDAWQAFVRLVSWARPRGLIGKGRLLSVWWDDQQITAPERTRSDAALFVDEDLEGDDEVRIRELPGGEFAVVPHGNAYEVLGLRRTYEAICGEWLPSLGREPGNAPPFDVYVTPSYSPALEYSLTMMHIPLARARA